VLQPTVFPQKDAVAFISEFILVRWQFKGSVYYFGQYERCNPGSTQLPFELWWRSIAPVERYDSSFQACGFSVDVDGTHDREIHCLEAGGAAADAHETIAHMLNSYSGRGIHWRTAFISLSTSNCVTFIRGWCLLEGGVFSWEYGRGSMVEGHSSCITAAKLLPVGYYSVLQCTAGNLYSIPV